MALPISALAHLGPAPELFSRLPQGQLRVFTLKGLESDVAQALERPLAAGERLKIEVAAADGATRLEYVDRAALRELHDYKAKVDQFYKDQLDEARQSYSWELSGEAPDTAAYWLREQQRQAHHVPPPKKVKAKPEAEAKVETPEPAPEPAAEAAPAAEPTGALARFRARFGRQPQVEEAAPEVHHTPTPAPAPEATPEIEPALAEAAPPDLPALKWGIEHEFALPHPLYDAALRTETPPDAFKSALEAVNRALGDDAGEIRVIVNEDGSHSAEMIDKLGREWKAVPEYVDSGRRKNGVELVSPPLTDGALALQQKIRAELKGALVPGVRSSTHNTVDVSHLVTPEGDATKLVDLILHIENHWPEIFAAIGPRRYGDLMNRFGIPLGINQRELMKELAALPNRSIDNVKAVFDKYRPREEALSAVEGRIPYKYRAANYNRLFPEDPAANGRAIEFRVADLLDEEDLPRVYNFLQALVHRGPELEAGKGFADSFPRFKDLKVHSTPEKARPQLAPINERMLQLTDDQHAAYLESLGLKPAEYPKFGGNHTNELRLSEAEIAALVRSVPLDKPIEVPGGRLSFGFEAEFKANEGPQEVVLRNASGVFGRGSAANVERFPFLDTKGVHPEGSGNMEVISVPTENLGEVLQNMKELRAHLGRSLRSYHFTIQVPKETIDSIGKAQVDGWMGRVSDSIQAWRMKNKSHFFALKTWSQMRQPISGLDERGPLRAYMLGNGRFRIELRGYMSGVEDIQKRALEIAAALRNPEYLRGLPTEQAAAFKPHPRAELKSLMESFKGGPLSEEEQDNLRKMMSGLAYSRDTHILPLVGYDAAPYLTNAERQRFADATWEFLQSAYRLMKREGLTDLGFGSRFRKLIKNWGDATGVKETLDSTILLRPGAKPAVNSYLVQKVLALPLNNSQAWLKALPKGTLERELSALRPTDFAAFVAKLPADPSQAKALWKAARKAVTPEGLSATLEAAPAKGGILLKGLLEERPLVDWLRNLPAGKLEQAIKPLDNKQLRSLEARLLPTAKDELAGNLHSLATVQAEFARRELRTNKLVKILSEQDAQSAHLAQALTGLPGANLRPLLNPLPEERLDAVINRMNVAQRALLTRSLEVGEDAAVWAGMDRALGLEMLGRGDPQLLRTIASGSSSAQGSHFFQRSLESLEPRQLRRALNSLPGQSLTREVAALSDEQLLALRAKLPKTVGSKLDQRLPALVETEAQLARRGLELPALHEVLAAETPHSEALISKLITASPEEMIPFYSSLEPQVLERVIGEMKLPQAMGLLDALKATDENVLRYFDTHANPELMGGYMRGSQEGWKLVVDRAVAQRSPEELQALLDGAAKTLGASSYTGKLTGLSDESLTALRAKLPEHASRREGVSAGLLGADTAMMRRGLETDRLLAALTAEPMRGDAAGRYSEALATRLAELDLGQSRELLRALPNSRRAAVLRQVEPYEIESFVRGLGEGDEAIRRSLYDSVTPEQFGELANSPSGTVQAASQAALKRLIQSKGTAELRTYLKGVSPRTFETHLPKLDTAELSTLRSRLWGTRIEGQSEDLKRLISVDVELAKREAALRELLPAIESADAYTGQLFEQLAAKLDGPQLAKWLGWIRNERLAPAVDSMFKTGKKELRGAVQRIPDEELLGVRGKLEAVPDLAVAADAALMGRGLDSERIIAALAAPGKRGDDLALELADLPLAKSRELLNAIPRNRRDQVLSLVEPRKMTQWMDELTPEDELITRSLHGSVGKAQFQAALRSQSENATALFQRTLQTRNQAQIRELLAGVQEGNLARQVALLDDTALETLRARLWGTRLNPQEGELSSLLAVEIEIARRQNNIRPLLADLEAADSHATALFTKMAKDLPEDALEKWVGWIRKDRLDRLAATLGEEEQAKLAAVRTALDERAATAAREAQERAAAVTIEEQAAPAAAEVAAPAAAPAPTAERVVDWS